VLRWVLIASLLAAMGASAQTRRKPKSSRPASAAAVTDPNAWPIESVAVEGNKVYTKPQILAISGIKVGERASKSDFDAARERLLASGAFDTVGCEFAPAPSGKGYAAKIQVAEVSQLFPAQFEDLPIDDAQLRAWLKQKDPMFGPKIPATEPALIRYKQLVTEYLAQHGYKDPISVKLTPQIPPELAVVFRPDALKPSVAQVRFTDTGDITPENLQVAMNPVAIGSVYTEPQFRQLLDTSIRPLYEAKGYLRVKFPKVVNEPAKDVKGIIVTTQVEQGPVYKLGKIGFTGADDLQPLVKLKTGELANFDEVKLAQGRIEESLRHKGFMQVSSKVNRKINDAEKTIDITYVIEPGPQFTFGKLIVVGLDITTEPELRKMWGLKEGKPFNPQYPAHFLEVVKEQGLFDNLKSTLAETKINSEAKTVDVTLTFK
jgi:outer membrane protein insertion porin family